MSMKKSEVLMRGLKEKLQKRLPSGWVFADSYDANGAPVLTLAQDASWATGDEKAVIRIKPVDQSGVNSLGQAQESFSPHVAQIVAEAQAASAIRTVLSDANKASISRELFALGTIVEMYISANTVEPAVAEMTPSQLAARLDDLQFPLIGSM